MKKFFIQDVKEGSQQAAYMFIAINVVFFVGGIWFACFCFACFALRGVTMLYATILLSQERVRRKPQQPGVGLGSNQPRGAREL